MKIFLVGFMGSGKTTVGRHLAQSLGFSFVDTDRFIEIQHGITVTGIFSQHGEDAFREMERNVLVHLQNFDSAVVATGGGLSCHSSNMNLMLACGKVIYLKASPQTLARRLIHSSAERPLISGKTETELLEYITEQLAIRETFYNRAHIVVDTDKYTIEEILNLLNIEY